MISPVFLLFVLFANVVLASDSEDSDPYLLGALWCHSGSEDLHPPIKCQKADVDKLCFKLTCDEKPKKNAPPPESPLPPLFVARGCGGLDPKTACEQAAQKCKSLRGIGECHTCTGRHYCNSATASQPRLAAFIALSILCSIAFELFTH